MIIGTKKIFRENLPSTNSFLTDLLRIQDLPEGTIVSANYQSAGRGYAGNRWESEKDKNLLLSILLRPTDIKPDQQFLISMVISLGVCDFSERYLRAARVKWPNDIYVNDDKIAGILIENSIMEDRIEYSVAGIGFNLNQEIFLSSAPNPISLKQITGADYDLTSVLTQISADLDNRYKQLLSGKVREIRDEYSGRLYRYNDWHNFRDSEGIFTGKITSISDNGLLRVERKAGNISLYSFKEIEFML
jgi:BirA family transcriptional regulator, biotin operon repressor / biotin---[acetyl-CoA-carboxylase] ligase